MARQQLKNYVFTPAGSGVGTVKLPGNFEIADILTVLNATDQTFIYNFGDSSLGGVVTWSTAYDADFPQSQNGVTTLTLTYSTTGMSASDSLAIYVETAAQITRPWEFGTDAIERMRVAPPQSLIDADFEYGLQNTKWQSLFLNNDVPSLYELPGSELSANTNGYVSFVGSTSFANATATVFTVDNQSGTVAPQWVNNDYILIVNPYVANPPPSTFVTANVINLNQRSITVNSTTGFSASDTLVIAYTPLTVATTVATTAITSGSTTWINLNSAANGFQPSFTQFASTVSYSSGTYASGGERLFAIPVNATNSGVLDLSRVKQIVTSAIPGSGVYPDGPEVLAINITSITAVAASGEIQISFTESQA